MTDRHWSYEKRLAWAELESRLLLVEAPAHAPWLSKWRMIKLVERLDIERLVDAVALTKAREGGTDGIRR